MLSFTVQMAIHSAMCLIDAVAKPDNHFACFNDRGNSISPCEAIKNAGKSLWTYWYSQILNLV